MADATVVLADLERLIEETCVAAGALNRFLPLTLNTWVIAGLESLSSTTTGLADRLGGVSSRVSETVNTEAADGALGAITIGAKLGVGVSVELVAVADTAGGADVPGMEEAGEAGGP